MKNYFYNRTIIFPDKFIEDITAVIPNKFEGLTPRGDTVVVVVRVDLSAQEEIDVQNVIDTITDEDAEIAAIKNELKAEADNIRLEKYHSDFEYDGHTFPGLTPDMENLKEAILTSLVDPTVEFNWKAKSGMVQLNASKLADINLLLAQKKDALWQASFFHKGNIDAILSLESLRSYDLEANWPS